MTRFTLELKASEREILRWYVEKFGEPEKKYKLKAYHSEYSDNWHVIKTCRCWRGIFPYNKKVHWAVFNQNGEVIHESPSEKKWKYFKNKW